MLQRPPREVVCRPACHDDEQLSVFLQAGLHRIRKPSPVLFFHQFVVGFFGVFDEVVDNHQRCPEAGRRSGGRCGKVVVVAALQAPQVHCPVAVLDTGVGEHIGVHRYVQVRLLLGDRVSHILGKHGGKRFVVRACHDFLRGITAEHPLHQQTGCSGLAVTGREIHDHHLVIRFHERLKLPAQPHKILPVRLIKVRCHQAAIGKKVTPCQFRFRTEYDQPLIHCRSLSAVLLW